MEEYKLFESFTEFERHLEIYENNFNLKFKKKNLRTAENAFSTGKIRTPFNPRLIYYKVEYVCCGSNLNLETKYIPIILGVFKKTNISNF